VTHSHHSTGRHDNHNLQNNKHAGHSVAMFRERFWIALLLTLPTVVWGHMLQRAFAFSPPQIPRSNWIPATLGTAVFVYGGTPFVKGAIRELRNRAPGMMTLIALAISVAFVFSVAVVLGFPGMPLWEELATLVTIMLLGHWIEMRSINQAEGALTELAKLLPDVAARVIGEAVEEIPVKELRIGDRVLVRPGARVPADGTVESGNSSIDESMLTGESQPLVKIAGDKVSAGTVNISGALRVDVTHTGNDTALAGIMRLVEHAQSSRSRAQTLADRAALILTVVALVAGVVTLSVWSILLPSNPAFAVERMVTVLVIACPHALGLAVPLVVAISTTLGARAGLLVRDRRGLEEARNLDIVVFDKTGTLTLGQHRVVAFASADGILADDALRIAAAVERDSEHPIARAIVKSAEEKGLKIPASTGFDYVPGQGISATVDGRHYSIGGANMLASLKLKADVRIIDFVANGCAVGHATIFLIENRRTIAGFAVADAVRAESKGAIDALRRAHIEVVMMTGDAKPVADAVARELGIETVFAQVLPEEKARHIEHLQAGGKKVAMVGDGVNDAPALVTADVGIAVGAGTDVAVEAGDIVLVRSDPRDIPRIVLLSRATYRKMIQNLWWAAGYNVVAIPLAAGALASRGIVLSPAVGAILMSASTVIVALNAQLLRRENLTSF
jgi:Cu2+-exporting ATPase